MMFFLEYMINDVIKKKRDFKNQNEDEMKKK